jgi:hypothetical protein
MATPDSERRRSSPDANITKRSGQLRRDTAPVLSRWACNGATALDTSARRGLQEESPHCDLVLCTVCNPQKCPTAVGPGWPRRKGERAWTCGDFLTGTPTL